MEEKAFLSFP